MIGIALRFDLQFYQNYCWLKDIELHWTWRIDGFDFDRTGKTIDQNAIYTWFVGETL